MNIDEARENAAMLAKVWANEVSNLLPPPILSDDVTPMVDDAALFARIDDMSLTLERLQALHGAYLRLGEAITLVALAARNKG